MVRVVSITLPAEVLRRRGVLPTLKLRQVREALTLLQSVRTGLLGIELNWME